VPSLLQQTSHRPLTDGWPTSRENAAGWYTDFEQAVNDRDGRVAHQFRYTGARSQHYSVGACVIEIS